MNIDYLIEQAGNIAMTTESRLTDDEIEKIAQELEAALVSPAPIQPIVAPVELNKEATILKMAEEKALAEAKINAKILKALNEDGFIDKLAQFKAKALENNHPIEKIDAFIKEAFLGKALRAISKGTQAAVKPIGQAKKALGKEWDYSKYHLGRELAGKKVMSREGWTKALERKKSLQDFVMNKQQERGVIGRTGQAIGNFVSRHPKTSAVAGAALGVGAGYGVHKGIEKAQEWQKNTSAMPEPYTQGYHPYYG